MWERLPGGICFKEITGRLRPVPAPQARRSSCCLMPGECVSAHRGLGPLPIELHTRVAQVDRTRTCNLPIRSGNRRGFDSPGTGQHDEPTAEHHLRPQAESNHRAQFCRLLPQPLGHAVLSAPSRARTCDLQFRKLASYPLDHGSIVREEGIEPSVPRRRGYGPQSTPPAQLALGVNNGYRTHISGATTRRSATELYPPRCPIDVPTAGPPRCERGALPLS